MTTRSILAAASFAALLTVSALAQEQKPDMQGMDMSGHDASKMSSSDMHEMPGMVDGSAQAMQSMEGRTVGAGAVISITE